MRPVVIATIAVLLPVLVVVPLVAGAPLGVAVPMILAACLMASAVFPVRQVAREEMVRERETAMKDETEKTLWKLRKFFDREEGLKRAEALIREIEPTLYAAHPLPEGGAQLEWVTGSGESIEVMVHSDGSLEWGVYGITGSLSGMLLGAPGLSESTSAVVGILERASWTCASCEGELVEVNPHGATLASYPRQMRVGCPECGWCGVRYV